MVETVHSVLVKSHTDCVLTVRNVSGLVSVDVKDSVGREVEMLVDTVTSVEIVVVVVVEVDSSVDVEDDVLVV